jgi:hypothetical protein
MVAAMAAVAAAIAVGDKAKHTPERQARQDIPPCTSIPIRHRGGASQSASGRFSDVFHRERLHRRQADPSVYRASLA